MIESSLIFFSNHSPTTDIYTLSLHDALPIWLRDAQLGGAILIEADLRKAESRGANLQGAILRGADLDGANLEDRKSTRLNSSHGSISYAVFCLKKKKERDQ